MVFQFLEENVIVHHALDIILNSFERIFPVSCVVDDNDKKNHCFKMFSIDCG